MKSCPTFEFEEKLWNKGLTYIAGVDEVGRGAFAGPVVAAAVILPQTTFQHYEEINDSKLLTAKRREELAEVIKQNAICYAISEISVEVINKLGVGKASLRAMFKAIQCLQQTPQHILIDAFYIPRISRKKQLPIIKGDQKSFSIAAASIIAKVYRDSLMRDFNNIYPHYCFEHNKGYGTKEHRKAIQTFGLSNIHRTSFELTKYLVSSS